MSDRSWPKRCRRIRKWSSHENAQKCSNRVGFCSDEIRHKTQWNCKETFLTPVWDLFLHRLNEIDSLLTFLSWLFDLNGTVLISKLLIAFDSIRFDDIFYGQMPTTIQKTYPFDQNIQGYLSDYINNNTMCKDVHQEFTLAYNRRKWINENPFSLLQYKWL